MKITLKKRYLAISAVLIALIVFMMLTGNDKEDIERRARALITVDTTELASFDYDIEMEYIGTLYAANAFEVNSKIAGRLIKMNYDIGDVIENGAIIAELDDLQYQLEYRQALGKLEMEKSKARQNEMAISLAEREYERNVALREEKVISESQLEKAQYDLERQQVNFDMDQANLANQQTAVEMAELRLSYTKIEAQWGEDEESGIRVLADRYVDVGEIISTNKPIASTMEIGFLKAEIFVGEKEYPLFKIGMKVTIEVDAFPGQSFEGEVDRVAPFLNEQTRQAKVLVSVKNQDLRLRPGMFARTNVTFARREGVPMLPKECIVEYRNEDGVYLYDEENKQVIFQRVQLGASHESNIEILNARAINMPVVSIGQHMVRHMMKVNHIKDIKKEEPPKRASSERKTVVKKKADPNQTFEKGIDKKESGEMADGQKTSAKRKPLEPEDNATPNVTESDSSPVGKGESGGPVQDSASDSSQSEAKPNPENKNEG